MCGGKGSSGSSGGGGTNTVTSTTSPPPQVLQAYQDLISRGQGVANTPLSQYPTGGAGAPNLVAGFTAPQQSAFNTIDQSQGVAQPYINQAAGLAGQSANSISPTAFSAQAVNQYQSPYTQQVVDATQAQFNNQNTQQAQSLKGNAISAGAWGGDRAGVAQAELANQQQLAQAPVIAGLYNQGYGQALNQFDVQQQAQLGAQQNDAARAANASYLLGGLGSQAQNSALTGASAQLQSGALQQQLQQEQLNVPYEQFNQQQAYPFQTTQFLGNLTEGLGSQEGGTSTTTSPNPSVLSQVGGLGVTGLAALGGSGAFGQSGWLKRGGRVGYASGGGTGGSVIDPNIGELILDVPDAGISPVPNSSGTSGRGAGSNGSGSSPSGKPLNSNSSITPQEAGQLASIFKQNPTNNNGGLGNQGAFNSLFNSGFGGGSSGAGWYGTQSAADNAASNAGISWFGDSAASTGASDVGSSAISDFGSSAATDLFAKRGGAITPHFDTGGVTVSHKNTWMQYPGEAIGAILGNTIGAPFGGSFWGPQAGKTGGLIFGDMIAGNSAGVQGDIQQDPVLSMAGSLGGGLGGGMGGGLPGMGAGMSPMGMMKRGGSAHFDTGGLAQAPLMTPQQAQVSRLYGSMTPAQIQSMSQNIPGSQSLATHAISQKLLNPESSININPPIPHFNGLGGYADGGDVDGGDDPGQSQDTQVAEVPDDSEAQYANAPMPPSKPPAPASPNSGAAWTALAAAGLGMMAGRSPNALQNIGAGGLEGLKTYTAQKQLEAQQAYRQQQQDIANRRENTLENHYENVDAKPQVDHSGPTVRVYYPSEKKWVDTGVPTTAGQRNQENAQFHSDANKIHQEQVDQGKYTWQPGTGPSADDPSSNVSGSWRFPTKGGEEPKFYPGAVQTAKGVTSDLINKLVADGTAKSPQEALQIIHDPTGAHKQSLLNAQESLAKDAAKNDPNWLKDPEGALGKWRTYYGMTAPPSAVQPGAAPAQAPAQAPAPPAAPPIPDALKAVPGLQFSPSRQQYKDGNGKVYDKDGNPIQ